MLEGRYQTKWMDLNLSNGYKVSLWDILVIPGLRARIEVAVYEGIPQQESVSEAGFHRYEAHSTCHGTFLGEDMTGFCCVEYVGDQLTGTLKTPMGELSFTGTRQ